MEIKKISYQSPMDRYYFQSFYDNILAGMEECGLVEEFKVLLGIVTRPGRVPEWVCVVGVEDMTVVAGAVLEYLPAVKCCMVEYCNAIPGHEDKMGEILDYAVDSLMKEYPDTKYIFTELIVDGDIPQCLKDRVRPLSINYVTPQVKIGRESTKKLEFSLVKSDVAFVPGDIAVSVLREYFKQCFADDVDTEQYVPHNMLGHNVVVLNWSKS